MPDSVGVPIELGAQVTERQSRHQATPGGRGRRAFAQRSQRQQERLLGLLFHRAERVLADAVRNAAQEREITPLRRLDERLRRLRRLPALLQREQPPLGQSQPLAGE